MIYTGIGSRETPPDILWAMERIGFGMAQRGHILRSGRAPGADQAFEQGLRRYMAQSEERLTAKYYNRAELYIPWRNFAEPSVWDIIPEKAYPTLITEAVDLVRHIHPAPDRLTSGALALHTRNIFQVLGPDLKTPTNLVLYWSKEDKHGKPMGGTATAVNLALLHAIPTLNMARPDWAETFKTMISAIQLQERDQSPREKIYDSVTKYFTYTDFSLTRDTPTIKKDISA